MLHFYLLITKEWPQDNQYTTKKWLISDHCATNTLPNNDWCQTTCKHFPSKKLPQGNQYTTKKWSISDHCATDTQPKRLMPLGCTMVWHRSLFGSVLVAQWSDISHFLVVYWLPCGHSLVVSRSRFLVVTTLLRVYRMTLWQRHFPTLLWPKNDVVTTLWQRWNVCWVAPSSMNSTLLNYIEKHHGSILGQYCELVPLPF